MNKPIIQVPPHLVAECEYAAGIAVGMLAVQDLQKELKLPGLKMAEQAISLELHKQQVRILGNLSIVAAKADVNPKEWIVTGYQREKKKHGDLPSYLLTFESIESIESSQIPPK